MPGNKKWQLLAVVACLVGIMMLYAFSRLEVTAFTCPDSLVVSPEMLKYADGATMNTAFSAVIKEFVTHINYTLGSSQHNATKLSELMTQLHAMKAELDSASLKMGDLGASAALWLNNAGGIPETKPTSPPANTDSPADLPTEPPKEPPPTEPPTKPMEPPTEKPTEKPTEPPTEKPTEKPTEAPTSAPVAVKKQQKRFIVGIATGYQYGDRRQACRDSWINYLKGRDDFEYKFFLGVTDNEELREAALQEQDKYNDIIFSDDFIDTYYNLSRKTIAMMNWASTNFEFKHMLKTDDDSFVRIDKVLERLDSKPTEKFYSGYNIGPYKPDRNPQSQYYIPRELYAPNIGPVLISGSGYVLSQDCVQYLAKKSKEPNIIILRLEDVNTAVWLEEIGVKGVGFPEFKPGQCPCMASMFLTHWCAPDKLRKMYENSKTGDGNMCRDMR